MNHQIKRQIEITRLLFDEAVMSFPDSPLIEIRVRENGAVEVRGPENVCRAIWSRNMFLQLINGKR